MTHVWIEVILVRTGGLGWCLRGSCGLLCLSCLLFAQFLATLELPVPCAIGSIGRDERPSGRTSWISSPP